MKLNFKEKYLIVLIALCFIVIGLYYSYAIFITKQLQENVVVIKSFNYNNSVKVNGKDEKIEILPKVNNDINVSFTNSDNINYYYRLLVKGIQSGMKLSSNNETTGTINAKESKSLSIRVNNETSEKINLEFIVQLSNEESFDKEIGYSYINSIENYDHSKANKPVIGKLKLIPVNYFKTSDTEGYWYKADVKNQDSIWYDYDNGLWANAVLVSDSNYNKYNKLSVGSEIDISDVLGFYVWIPRFKYSIINNSNYTNYERINNVIFENGNESTGTIICVDKISNNLDQHIYSETCQDDVNKHIYDGLSTYTHPAFKNNNGFWVAKFLMGEGEKTLPNVHILKKKISDANDISDNIANSHVLTNMEYAAIITLANSSYGKTGNSIYSDKSSTTFTRIYANMYEHEVTGCSSEYTAYSKNFITEKTSKCIEYNNLTNLSHYSNGVFYPIGYVGAGASSTGTVHGVYDLASITGELTSAFIADMSGQVSTNIKNYDLYSYNDYIGIVSSSSNIHNLYRYKLGDAIRENFRSFTRNGMWNSGVLTQNEKTGIIIRGGNNNPLDASVYTASIENMEYVAPFRIVLNP